MSGHSFMEMFMTALAATYEVRVASVEVLPLAHENAYEVVGWLSRNLPSGNILSGPLRCRIPAMTVIARDRDGLRVIAGAIADGGLRQLLARASA
jgi:hypothetical protein